MTAVGRRGRLSGTGRVTLSALVEAITGNDFDRHTPTPKNRRSRMPYQTADRTIEVHSFGFLHGVPAPPQAPLHR